MSEGMQFRMRSIRQRWVISRLRFVHTHLNLHIMNVELIRDAVSWSIAQLEEMDCK